MFEEHEPKLNEETGATMTGRSWRRSFFLLLALALALTVSLAAFAANDAQAAKKRTQSFTKQDTEKQADTNSQVSAQDAQINQRPFTFSGTSRITSINNVALVFTVRASTTDFNPRQLSLVLDGIDTGLRAQVFSQSNSDGNNTTYVLFFSGTPDNADQILNELQQDGQLDATLNDNSRNDSNMIKITNDNTTLAIQGKQTRR